MLPHLTVCGEWRISIPQGELCKWHRPFFPLGTCRTSCSGLWAFCLLYIGQQWFVHMGAHVTATCTEFLVGYGGPGQVYSLCPCQHEGSEESGLSPTSSSLLLFSSKAQLGRSELNSDSTDRLLVKSSRLLRCRTLRPRPKCTLN